LVDRRTEAKLLRDFELADSLREELIASGIDLVDRERTWSSHDGRVHGFQQRISERIFDPSAPPRQPRAAAAAGGGWGREAVACTLTAEQAQALVDVRTRARRARNFELADSVKDDLRSSGIELLDKENTWRAFDGSISGVQAQDYIVRETRKRQYSVKEDFGPSVACSITAREAQELVDKRVQARKRRDFDLADSLRAQLVSRGIELLDKEFRWEAFDRSIGGSQ